MLKWLLWSDKITLSHRLVVFCQFILSVNCVIYVIDTGYDINIAPSGIISECTNACVNKCINEKNISRVFCSHKYLLLAITKSFELQLVLSYRIVSFPCRILTFMPKILDKKFKQDTTEVPTHLFVIYQHLPFQPRLQLQLCQLTLFLRDRKHQNLSKKSHFEYLHLNLFLQSSITIWDGNKFL